ncbi:MAG: hypothetical protein ABL907_26370 [Hyphomicrobium sp.]
MHRLDDSANGQFDRDLGTAMRVVSAMGLLEFNIRFIQVWFSYWWWGYGSEADF